MYLSWLVNWDVSWFVRAKEIPAMLDCGAVVMVPEFITEGMKIKVNTESKVYISKADTS